MSQIALSFDPPSTATKTAQVIPLPVTGYTIPKNQQDLLRLVYSNGGNRTATIVLHEDPGHGWLQVPHSLISKLGISKKISGYSYRDTNFAYLEEDCDLSLFCNALCIEPGSDINKILWEVVPREYKEDSPIRNKNRYV